MSESHSQSVSKSVDGIVHIFIQEISETYDISAEELLGMWEGNEVKPTKKLTPKKVVNVPTSEDTSDNNRSANELMKCTKAELVEMCAKRGLKKSGTKPELVARLTGEAPDTKPKSGGVKTSPKISTNNNKTPVVKKVTEQLKKISIKRNGFSNYEHPESGLIFNPKTEKCIGKQLDDGTVAPLTDDDIDTCNKYKFKYEIPENLDSNALEDENIEEMEDEEEEEESDLDEEELLEDEEDEVEDDEEEFEIEE